MGIYQDDFFDMLDDMEDFDNWERKKKCKRECPEYKSCRANFDKCKYRKKKKGWFF
jgi:hypothetical protein